jgi:uncharacterized protein YgbK (DUF1537 family)
MPCNRIGKINMLKYTETIQSLPPVYREPLTGKNRQLFLDSGITVIVLDDDPTGTQTISDVPVLTGWDQIDIENMLLADEPLFFILTNSRSLPEKEAGRLAYTIGHNIKNASEKARRETIVISRGDSTLRGHYPNEVDALGAGLEIKNTAHILIPTFFQGGRITVDDIHYVREGDDLIPAGETPFARDSSFGYRSSDLKDYVEEKTKGVIKATEVVSISLDEIRMQGYERVATVLRNLQPGQVCIVNAADQTDLDVFTCGYYMVRKRLQTSFLFRTAASMVPSLSGVQVKPPMVRNHFAPEGKGGLVAIGSYVPMTFRQLEFMKQHFPVEYIEIDVSKLMDHSDFKTETGRVAARINANLEINKVAVVYTSREVIKGNSPEESLQIINRVSSGMVESVKRISFRPGFIIAKGGITSSDLLTKALEVKCAFVLGQIIPGVPVWRLDDSPKFPGLIYLPFPGNLGGDDALYKVVQKLV